MQAARWALVLLAVSWSSSWIPSCSADLSSWAGLRIDGPAKELYESMSAKFHEKLAKGEKFIRRLPSEDEEDSLEVARRGEVVYELTGEGGPMQRKSVHPNLQDDEAVLDRMGMWTDRAALEKYLVEHRAEQSKLMGGAERHGEEESLLSWFEAEGLSMRIMNRIEELKIEEKGGMDHPDGARFDLQTLPCYNEDDDEISSTVGVRDASGEEDDDEDEEDGEKVDEEEVERVAEHDKHLEYLSNPFGVPRGPRQVIDPKPQKELSKEEREVDELIMQNLIDLGIPRHDILSNFSRELKRGEPVSPYHPALKRRFKKIMERHKTVERDPALRSKPEWLVLNWHFFKACRLGDVRSMQILLDIGAPIHSRDELWGDTPLHDAAGAGRTEAVRLLLDLGADVNALTFEEWTPLHMAAASGNAEVVRMLLARGADADAHAGKPYGHSPLDVAKFYGFYAPHPVGSAIMAAGGKITPTNWAEEAQREAEELMAQRARISEETSGKMNQPGPAFKPKAWSLTVALGTRDTRDPNRHGHIKRSQLDSMDLLQFRHIEYDKMQDVPEVDEQDTMLDRVAGNLVGAQAPARPRQPHPKLRRGAGGEAGEAPCKVMRGDDQELEGSEGAPEMEDKSEGELPSSGESSSPPRFGGQGGARQDADFDEDMLGFDDDGEGKKEEPQLAELITESESVEGDDDDRDDDEEQAARELMRDKRFGVTF